MMLLSSVTARPCGPYSGSADVLTNDRNEPSASNTYQPVHALVNFTGDTFTTDSNTVCNSVCLPAVCMTVKI